jgi:hypothetical protein
MRWRDLTLREVKSFDDSTIRDIVIQSNEVVDKVIRRSDVSWGTDAAKQKIFLLLESRAKIVTTPSL